MLALTELFCKIDDFYLQNEPLVKAKMIETREKKRNREKTLSTSEIMTITILFHQTGFRNFKTFYQNYVCVQLRKEFHGLVSYNRFVEIMPDTLIYLLLFIMLNKGKATGISYVDSTSIAVCDNIRINRNKVFKGVAKRGKTSMGWFFGFKLHLIINEQGEILNFCITPGNVNDRCPVKLMAKGLTGKLFGDKGYISNELFSQLQEQGLQLITTLKKNMKNRIMTYKDKMLLRKRYVIETVNDQLKNICNIEHTRHRSINNFTVNLLSGLIAYILKPQKPSITFYENLAIN